MVSILKIPLLMFKYCTLTVRRPANELLELLRQHETPGRNRSARDL
ncbi:hypothetical protein BofuT4_uP014250.1 [Botrytis cinerea T4]|uniref:Uncharacterized protein n=1 Tax=Botryotinia fuckeliana (strain T4) TaxID=999810 RepID=G2XN41_BOTF4|nr:hypothetical protein BofuT4_uP014250.1 [Botrytis cinerea T4]